MQKHARCIQRARHIRSFRHELAAVHQQRRRILLADLVLGRARETKSLIMEVRVAGAHGYIVKSQAARGLIVAIDRILAKARSSARSQMRPPPRIEHDTEITTLTETAMQDR